MTLLNDHKDLFQPQYSVINLSRHSNHTFLIGMVNQFCESTWRRLDILLGFGCESGNVFPTAL